MECDFDVQCKSDGYNKNVIAGAWKELDNSIAAAKEDQLNERIDLAKKLFREVEKTWKTYIYKDWLPCVSQDHYCSVSRSKRHNVGLCNENIGDCVLQHVPFDLYKTRNGEYHPCIKGYCSNRYTEQESLFLHYTYVQRYVELYICTYSGKPHYCGDFCSITSTNHLNKEEYNYYLKYMYNSDGILTCPLTGITFGIQKGMDGTQEEELTYDRIDSMRLYKEYALNCKDRPTQMEKQAIKTIKKSGSDSFDKYDHELGRKLYKSDFVLTRESLSCPNGLDMFEKRFKGNYRKDCDEVVVTTEELHSIIEGIISSPKHKIDDTLNKLKRGPNQSFKEYYLVVAAIKMADILSPAKLDDSKVNSEKKSTKAYKPFISYFNKCTSEGRTPNACELSIFLKLEEKSIYTPPAYNLPNEFTTSFVIDYAKLAVQAWYAIVTVTTAGKETPHLFKFVNFIDAFVSLLRTGYSVEISRGQLVSIYSQERLFAILPSPDDDERRKGDYVNKQRRKHINSVKRNIQTAIFQTVVKENIHYNKISPYSYDYDSLEEHHFVDFKECQRGNKRKKRARGSQMESEGEETSRTYGMEMSFKKLVTEQGERAEERLNRMYRKQEMQMDLQQEPEPERMELSAEVTIAS